MMFAGAEDLICVSWRRFFEAVGMRPDGPKGFPVFSLLCLETDTLV